MFRLFLIAQAVIFCAALAASSGKPDPLPKDTLPAKLDISQVPLGLATQPVPKDNPLRSDRVALGRQLFFDPLLSGDQTVSCASCHSPDRGFSHAKPLGVRGQLHRRKAPTLLNRAYGTSFFWDGRSASLEDQALKPIEDPAEMGADLKVVLQRLKDNKSYQRAFASAFPDGVTATNLARSLASFQRVLLRGDSRVDRFRKKSEHTALTPEERHGLWLYESKAQCWRCHSGPNFTNEQFHNTGVGIGKKLVDKGREEITKQPEDRGKFKTPTLRGLVLTAPYMHDSSIQTLEEVVEFYNKGGVKNPNLDPRITPLKLSREEVRALVAFLKAL